MRTSDVMGLTCGFGMMFLPALAQSVTHLDIPANFRVAGASRNGMVLFGREDRPSAEGVQRAAIWTSERGLRRLDGDPGRTSASEALASSDDGRFIAGKKGQAPFVWSAEGGWRALPVLTGYAHSTASYVLTDPLRVGLDPRGNHMPTVCDDRRGEWSEEGLRSLVRPAELGCGNWGIFSPTGRYRSTTLADGRIATLDPLGNVEVRALGQGDRRWSIQSIGDDGLVAGSIWASDTRVAFFFETQRDRFRIIDLPTSFEGGRSFEFGADRGTVIVHQNREIAPGSFSTRVFVWRDGDGFHPLAAYLGGLRDGRYSTARCYSFHSETATLVVDFGLVAIYPQRNIYRVTLDPLPICRADFDADRLVGDEDLVTFIHAYDVMVLPDADDRCDMNNDFVVDDADFVLFAAAYSDLACP